jgi:hypothetical protein
MGSRLQIPRNQFGLIWSKLNPQVWPCLRLLGAQLGSSNHELFFELFFWKGSNQLILVHIGLALNCLFLMLNPHLKAMGPIYGSHYLLCHHLGHCISPCAFNPILFQWMCAMKALLIEGWIMGFIVCFSAIES